MDMDISMDIHAKSVDMDMDVDGKFHIHGNPGDQIRFHGASSALAKNKRLAEKRVYQMTCFVSSG